MARYIAKRLLVLIPTVVFVVFLIFFIISLMPSSPGCIILGLYATEEEVEQLNESMGYNDPLPVQFVRYLGNAVRGDFGTSYQSGREVFDVLLPRFPTTFKLAILSMLVACILGIPLGVLSAVKQYSLADTSTTVLSLLFASIPSFFLGILLMLLFAWKLDLLPPSGVGTPAHYVLPVLTLALPVAAYLSRLTRTTMLDAMGQDYIVTARAKGCPARRVIFGHALRNALMPVVTQAGMSFAALLGGSIIVEQVFGMPGFGSTILTAIQYKDSPLIIGATVFLAVLFVLIMLAVDLIYAVLDPRVAAKNYGGKG
ncbi:MAG: ABC transporter permease [Oscillospiraceae bacterium]|nr:ABC transporter permease [Oscillospiraceae bacterium]